MNKIILSTPKELVSLGEELIKERYINKKGIKSFEEGSSVDFPEINEYTEIEIIHNEPEDLEIEGQEDKDDIVKTEDVFINPEINTDIPDDIVKDKTIENEVDINTEPVEPTEQENNEDANITYINNLKIKEEEAKEIEVASIDKAKEDIDKNLNTFKDNSTKLKELEKDKGLDPEQIIANSKKKFSKDLFFNALFSTENLSKSAFIQTTTLADKKELWDDNTVQSYFSEKYGDNAKEAFNEQYATVLEHYSDYTKQKVIETDSKRQQNENVKVNYLTALQDALIEGKSEDYIKTLTKEFQKADISEISLNPTVGRIGEQFVMDKQISSSPYENVADAFVKSGWVNEFGLFTEATEKNREALKNQDQWLAASDELYSMSLSDYGKVYMETFDSNSRQKLSKNIIPEYEFDENSMLRRMTKNELEGFGDWTGALLVAPFINTGLQLTNSVVSMIQAVTSIYQGEDMNNHGSYTDSLNQTKNWIRRYTPGRTYDMVNHMWGWESLATGVADGMAQIVAARLLGGGLGALGGGRVAQEMFVRSMLTLYASGTAYDEALDHGFSNRESFAFMFTTFAGMWKANSLSKWITDSASSRAVFADMKKFIQKQMPKAIEEFESVANKTVAVGKLNKFWAGVGDQWRYLKKPIAKVSSVASKISDSAPKIFKNEMVHGFVEEGREEMTEEIFQEAARQGHNLYSYLRGNDLNKKGFDTIDQAGYLSNLANNVVYSGVMGGITGGTLGSIKMIKNRGKNDVKNVDAYIDIIAQDKEKQFLQVMEKMQTQGYFGSSKIDIRLNADGTIKRIKQDQEDFSQEHFNMSIILRDYTITKKTLGDLKDLHGIKLPTEANIDAAVVAKKALKENYEIYTKYDIDFDTYKNIVKEGLEDYNKTRLEKDLTEIKQDDFDKLSKNNNLIIDIGNGTYHQYLWFKSLNKFDKIFGDINERSEDLKGEQFDDLFYNYFKKIMESKSDDEKGYVEDINKLSNLENEVKIYDNDNKLLIKDINELNNIVSKFSELGNITPEKKKHLLNAFTSFIKEDELFKENKVLQTERFNELASNSLSQEISKIDIDIKNVNDKLVKAENRTNELTKKIEDLEKELSSHTEGSRSKGDITKDIDKAKEELKGFNVDVLNKSITDYNVIRENYVNALEQTKTIDNNYFKSLPGKGNSNFSINLERGVFPKIEDFPLEPELIFRNINNPSINFHLEDIVTLLNKHSFTERELDLYDLNLLDETSKEEDEIKAKYGDTFSKISSLNVSSLDNLRNKLIVDTDFLNKMSLVNPETGEISGTYLPFDSEFADLIAEMREGISEVEKEDVKIQIIGETMSKEEVGNLLKSLMIHNSFIQTIQRNIKSLNSVNRLINSAKEGDILAAFKTEGKTANLLKAFKRTFIYNGYNNKIDKTYNKLFSKEIDTKTESISSLENKILEVENKAQKENRELTDDEKSLINQIQEHIKAKKLLFDNIFDYDRVRYLEAKRKLSSDEKVELDAYHQKAKNLTAPSVNFIKMLISGTVNPIEDVERIYSNLEQEQEKINLSLEKDRKELSYLSKQPISNKENIEYLNKKINDTLSRLEDNKNKFEKLEVTKDSITDLETKAQELIEEDKAYYDKLMSNKIAKEEQTKMIKDGSPLQNFIDKKIQDKFYSAEGYTDINGLFKFMEDLFRSKDLSILDKSKTVGVVFEVLKEQLNLKVQLGEGFDYKEELKNNVVDLTNILKQGLQGKQFKCFNN